tara:strand:+ start:411 stop:590 length:180 start_codon:yes stop_codon:yes gene_type:complete
MTGLVRLILGLFGIREVTKEDGLWDRTIDSPTARLGYTIVISILIILVYNSVKDLKLFK